MSKKFRLLMALVLVIGLFGGLMTASTVSADPDQGKRIQVPRIDVEDLFGGGDWDTLLQIQNTSSTVATWVAVTYWKTYTDECPPNATAALSTYHKQYVQANGIWTLTPPADARSAIVCSMATEPTSKPDLTNPANCTGAVTLAVTVDRWGMDLNLHELASSYVGISEGMETDTKYFAPYVMYDYNHSLDTTISIQNSGELCTSVWIYYKEQGNCEYQISQHITELAPGEAIRVGPGGDLAFPAALMGAGGWLGSAYISANEPLGIIVDQWTVDATNDAGTLLTFRGLPYDYAETEWYADFLYREISGWTSSIQVQNLTVESKPTFVTVNFMDQSGDEVLFVGDWICRNGTKTFYLPAIIDLGHNFPFGYVGAAEIQSHNQVDYPGNEHEGQNIFVVVDMKKTKMWDPDLGIWRPTAAGETQGGAYNAHPEDQKLEATGWALPFIAREGQGVTSKIVIRNNSNCNKIRPKVTLYDETGREVYFFWASWLQPKHMTVIDLNNFPVVTAGFVGAAKVTVDPGVGVEQLCDTDGDGKTNPEPVMPSVVVMNYSWEAELGEGRVPPLTIDGDLCRIYEGIPYATGSVTCDGSLYGDVTVRQADHGYDREEIKDVAVTVTDEDGLLIDTTDSTGGYQIPGVTVVGASGDVTMAFTKTGFFDGAETPTVYCGDETQQNFELICSNPMTVTTWYSTTTAANVEVHGGILPGVLVEGLATYDDLHGTDEFLAYTVTTDNDGVKLVNVAGGQTITGTATLPSGYDAAAATWTYVDGAGVCLQNPFLTFTLCQWSSVVGTATIGGVAAAGYRVDAVRSDTWAVVDTDTTTANGVFALDNFSTAVRNGTGGPYNYHIRLYNPNNTLVSTKTDIVPDRCGDTGVVTYTNGTWTGATW